jgi:hypothetical protein
MQTIPLHMNLLMEGILFLPQKLARYQLSSLFSHTVSDDDKKV